MLMKLPNRCRKYGLGVGGFASDTTGMALKATTVGPTSKIIALITAFSCCCLPVSGRGQSVINTTDGTVAALNSGTIAQQSFATNTSLRTNPDTLSTITPLPPIAEPELISSPIGGSVNGQNAPLSLNESLALAMANNPTLRQSAARVESQRGNWKQQGLYPNPRVSYKADEIGDDNAAGFQGFTVAQEIVTTGKLKKARNVASQQIIQAEQELTAQQIRVQNDVKVRFYNVLLAQRAVELNQELEQISRTAANAADDLFRAAQVGRSDVLQARVEADLIQLQTVKARNSQQSAWRQLTVALGLPDMDQRPLVGDLQQDIINTTWDQAWTCIYSTSPELAAAQAKLSAARFAAEKAQADRFQNWDIEGGYAHDNATGFDTGGITVAIPLPLYNRNQGGIAQAEAELHAAQAEVDRVGLDLRNRLALIFERYLNAKETVDRYQSSILPNARESIDLTSHRYQAGETNYPAVLLAQRVYLQTQVSYLDALRELRETSTLLAGLLLSDSLSGVGK